MTPRNQNKNYHLGILYLMHLLVNADGVIDQHEHNALRKVKDYERMPEDTLVEFEKSAINLSEKEIYQKGIDFLNHCNDEEKLDAFAHLSKMTEADGRVHVKEVRLLLYSIRMAKIEFNEVLERAKNIQYN
ncbi:MAG: TerB family tellurite resistance protein [Cyclobacteriaceae bacterium]|nr:TerB family tellurite resistance protein [Cyclobacteriaceae bacterium]